MTDGIRSVECLQGNGLDKSFAFAISQMILDIFGDLLSKLPMVWMNSCLIAPRSTGYSLPPHLEDQSPIVTKARLSINPLLHRADHHVHNHPRRRCSDELQRFFLGHGLADILAVYHCQHRVDHDSGYGLPNVLHFQTSRQTSAETEFQNDLVQYELAGLQIDAEAVVMAREKRRNADS